MQKFESWLNNVAGEEYLWAIELFVIVATALLAGYLANKIILLIEAHASKTRTVWDDALIEACRKPVVWLIWVFGINFAAGVAARHWGTEWGELVGPVNRLAVIFLGMLFLLNFISRAERNLVDPKYLDEPMDKTTVKAVAKLLRAAVVITAVLIAMQIFGYSISGVLAFGGIGGIAIGFAAKDLLANFFGGMMIYLDRPFAVGEWVRSPDREIEGTVEDIGWRLTRIRTFDKRPLYVPNSIFNTISIENPSRMLNRRIYETIGVRYDDVSKMQAILEQVRTMLEQHEAIDHSQTLMVNFNTFSASSLDFFIYTFTRTTVWAEFHQVKQDVLLKISGIIEDNGAEIAYPTSTVHVPERLLIAQAVKDA